MFTRFNGNVVPFADDATSTNRTVFGGVTQSDAIDDNLNADFKKGWEIVGLNDNPTREDFNAMGYTLGALIAYLYEMGISEWNASQNYRTNSRVIGSDGKVYKALTGTIGTPNVNHNPISGSVNWENESDKYVDLINNQKIYGTKTFNNFPITPSSSPTTNYQVANKKYVDDGLSLKANTADLKEIGVGQTWQDLTASRAIGVTYTNTTGKPIELSITCRVYSSQSFSIYCNGTLISTRQGSGPTSTPSSIGIIVPVGATYRVDVFSTVINNWSELR